MLKQNKVPGICYICEIAVWYTKCLHNHDNGFHDRTILELTIRKQFNKDVDNENQWLSWKQLIVTF